MASITSEVVGSTPGRDYRHPHEHQPDCPGRTRSRHPAPRRTELAFLSTTTVFGTPREVTLSELAIEAFYPADDATRRTLHSL